MTLKLALLVISMVMGLTLAICIDIHINENREPIHAQ